MRTGKGWHIFGYPKRIIVLAALFLSAVAGQVWAAEGSEQRVQLTASELFAFADAARDREDYELAETAYRALSTNPDIELQTEAHFRLGMMLADQQHKYREAATEFRRILDYKPKAARVRLELARMQALMGNLGAAEREMRAAEANGLPPQVERMVRFYANALSASKPLGASVEVAIAPDSNINRATRSDTLGTVIGDFTLDQNAKARSGVGLALRGKAYARMPLGAKTNLLARMSGSADIYRESDFDDFIVGLQVGPELTLGRDKIAMSAGPAWRWYGAQPYCSGHHADNGHRNLFADSFWKRGRKRAIIWDRAEGIWRIFHNPGKFCRRYPSD